jgi:hypothetical protein
MLGRGGERRGRYNKTIKVQKGSWMSKKLSKLKKGVGGSRTFPTWKGGLMFRKNRAERERKQIEVQEESRGTG